MPPVAYATNGRGPVGFTAAPGVPPPLRAAVSFASAALTFSVAAPLSRLAFATRSSAACSWDAFALWLLRTSASFVSATLRRPAASAWRRFAVSSAVVADATLVLLDFVAPPALSPVVLLFTVSDPAASYGGVTSSSATPTLAQGSAGPASSGAIAVAPNEVLVSVHATCLAPTVTSGTVRRTADHASGFDYIRILEGTGASPQTNGATTGNAWGMVSVKLGG